MARFLSEEWFGLVRAAVVDAPVGAPPAAAGDRAVTVRHRVTGGPHGDVDYVVRAGSGGFSVVAGAEGPADIEVIESYESAARISRGHLTPAAAFAAGSLTVTGDVGLLTARQDEFAALGDLLAPVRAVTTY